MNPTESTRKRSSWPSARAFLPEELHSYTHLAAAAQACQGCALFREATQAVFGRGAVPAALMVVGEAPGDREDQQGVPFVGPAGRLLERAFHELGIDRQQIYLTNAVKHFKFTHRGPVRLHKKPLSSEIQACHPWLEAEIHLVRPKVLLCLGATALQSVLGRAVAVGEVRGVFIPHASAHWVMVTVHPSAILRIPQTNLREQEYQRMVNEINLAFERSQRSAN